MIASGMGSVPDLPKLWAQNLKQATSCLTPRVFLQVELKSQEVQSLQQLLDQYVAAYQQYAVAYQQYVAACQQLAAEKEALHQQVLLQTELIDQLRQEDVQGKAEVDTAHQVLQETQVRDWGSGPSGKACNLCPFSLFPGL